jgi:hypothetical protein
LLCNRSLRHKIHINTEINSNFQTNIIKELYELKEPFEITDLHNLKEDWDVSNMSETPQSDYEFIEKLCNMTGFDVIT